MEKIMILHEAKNDHWNFTAASPGNEFLPMGLALIPMDSGEAFPDAYGQIANDFPARFFAFGDSDEDDDENDFDDMDGDDYGDEEDVFEDDDDEDEEDEDEDEFDDDEDFDEFEDDDDFEYDED